MRRRDFVKIVAGIAALWPLAARAQQPERIRRVAVLMSFADPSTQSYVTAFRGALTKLGWTEGKEKSHGMVRPENINSGHSNSQLGVSCGRHHHNHAYLRVGII